MDVASLKLGDDINGLQPKYVIFICTFDPFEKELYRSTFANRCLERYFPLEAGAVKLFLSTKGKNSEEVSQVLVNFLRYLENSTDEHVRRIEDRTIDRLHAKIAAIKESREW